MENGSTVDALSTFGLGCVERLRLRLRNGPFLVLRVNAKRKRLA